MHNLATIKIEIRKVMRILTLSLVITTLLMACSQGGYQQSKQWEYNANTSKTAQNPPRPINETTQANAQAAQIPGLETAPAPYNQSAMTKNNNLPPVKVALLVPLSGKHAKLGQSMLNAAQLALFDLGHNNFQIIPKDTRANANDAATAAKEAIDDGAELIIGPVFAEAVRAVKPIAASSRINVIAFSTDWSLAGGNTFIMGFLPFDQVERLTRYVASHNITSVGIFAPNDNYGRAVTNAFTNQAARNSLQTAATSTFNPRSRNLSTDVRAFAKYDSRPENTSAPFDAVLMPVGGQNAITIANLLTQYGLTPNTVKRLGTGLMDDTGLSGEPGLDGAWFAAPSPTLRRNFEDKYMKVYGQKAPRLTTLAYDATALSAILAQRGQQSQGRPQFDKNYLLNPNGFFGIDGIFRFRSDGTAERGLAVLEFNRGRIKVIDEAPKTFETTRY